MKRRLMPTFLKPGKIEKFEVGLWFQFQQTENKAVGKTDFLIAVKRHSEVVIVESVFQWNNVMDAKHPQWPRRHDPLDCLRLAKEDRLSE